MRSGSILKEMANTPGKINMRWKGECNYNIYSTDDKKMKKVHVDRMKKFHGKVIEQVAIEKTKEKDILFKIKKLA